MLFSVKCHGSVYQIAALSVTNHYVVYAAAFSEINYGWCILHMLHLPHSVRSINHYDALVIKGNITHYNDHIVTRNTLLLVIDEKKSEFVSFITWNHPFMPRVIMISRKLDASSLNCDGYHLLPYKL